MVAPLKNLSAARRRPRGPDARVPLPVRGILESGPVEVQLAVPWFLIWFPPARHMTEGQWPGHHVIARGRRLMTQSARGVSAAVGVG